MLEFVREADIGGCKVPLRNKETGQFIGCLVGYKTQSTPSILRSFKQMDGNFSKRNNKAVATARDFRQFEDTAFNPRKFQYAEQVRDAFLTTRLSTKFKSLLASKYDLSNPIDSAQFSQIASSAEFKKILASIHSSVNLTSTKDREAVLYNIYTNYTKLSRLTPKEIQDTTDRIYPDSSLENNSINRINRINALRQKFPELGELERMAQLDIGDLGRKEAFITSNVEPLRKALLQKLSKMSPEQAASLTNGKFTYENIPESLIKEIGDHLTSLHQLVYDKDLGAQIVRSSEMSRPGSTEDGINIGYFGIGSNFKSRINDPLKATLWHLAGHKIQFDDQIVRDFKYETEGTTSVYPLEGFGIPVRPDNHGLPYVGRDYDSDSNEVLPMGLAALSSGSQLYEMLRMEPGVVTTAVLALDSLEAPRIDLDLSKLKELDPDAIRKFKQLEKDNPIEYLKMLEAYRKSNKVSEVTSANLLPIFSDDEKRLVLGDLSDKFGLLSEEEYDRARNNLIEALGYFDTSLQRVSYLALKSVTNNASIAVLPSQEVALGIKEGDELEMVQGLTELVLSQNPELREEYIQGLSEEMTPQSDVLREIPLTPFGLGKLRQEGMYLDFDRTRLRMEKEGILPPVSHAPKDSPGAIARQQLLQQGQRYEERKALLAKKINGLKAWAAQERQKDPSARVIIDMEAKQKTEQLRGLQRRMRLDQVESLQQIIMGQPKPVVDLKTVVKSALEISTATADRQETLSEEMKKLKEETKLRESQVKKERAAIREEQKNLDEEMSKLRQYAKDKMASGVDKNEVIKKLGGAISSLTTKKNALEKQLGDITSSKGAFNKEMIARVKAAKDQIALLESEARKAFTDAATIPGVVMPKLFLGSRDVEGNPKPLNPEDDKLIEKFQDGFNLFSSMMQNYDLASQEGSMVIDRKKSDDGGNPRSHYSGLFNTVRMTPTADLPVVVHEWGHWAEKQFPSIREKVTDFLERRTKGESEQKLAELTGNSHYDDSEVTRPDAFLNEYMGKSYDDASEIFSMGLEYMVRDPLRFAQEDPDMFEFIYNLMSNYSDPEKEATAYAEAEKIEDERRLEREKSNQERELAKLNDFDFEFDFEFDAPPVTRKPTILGEAPVTIGSGDTLVPLIPEMYMDFDKQSRMTEEVERTRARMAGQGIPVPVSHAPENSPGTMIRQKLLAISDSNYDVEVEDLRSYINSLKARLKDQKTVSTPIQQTEQLKKEIADSTQELKRLLERVNKTKRQAIQDVLLNGKSWDSLDAPLPKMSFKIVGSESFRGVENYLSVINDATVLTEKEINSLDGQQREMYEKLQLGTSLVATFIEQYGIPDNEVTLVMTTYIRAFYSNEYNMAVFDVAEDAPTVVHELGHWAEHTFPEIAEKVQNFLERRTKYDKSQPLANLTGNDAYRKSNETTKPDAFLSEYIGKEYGSYGIELTSFSGGKSFLLGSTEVFSMGLEYMVRDPIRFAKEDPDMFDFIYNLMVRYSDPEAEAAANSKATKIDEDARMELYELKREEEERFRKQMAEQEDQQKKEKLARERLIEELQMKPDDELSESEMLLRKEDQALDEEADKLADELQSFDDYKESLEQEEDRLNDEMYELEQRRDDISDDEYEEEENKITEKFLELFKKQRTLIYREEELQKLELNITRRRKQMDIKYMEWARFKNLMDAELEKLKTIQNQGQGTPEETEAAITALENRMRGMSSIELENESTSLNKDEEEYSTEEEGLGEQLVALEDEQRLLEQQRRDIENQMEELYASNENPENEDGFFKLKGKEAELTRKEEELAKLEKELQNKEVSLNNKRRELDNKREALRRVRG